MKNNNELVSVIMSTYKEDKKQLIQAIESILNQTYNNLEIIIVLDNPESKYIEKIIDEYVVKDERIIFIKNEVNKGLTASLNEALDVAKGKYIARMDADDISSLVRIEKQMKYLVEKQIDLLGTDISWIDEDGKMIYEKMGVPVGCNHLEKLLKVSNCVAHPTWLVKKQVYKELGGYRNIPMSEDYDFLLRAVKNNYKIDNLNEVLLSYRMTKNSISRSNALGQFLTSRYLQVHLNRIEQITSDEVVYNLQSKVTSKKEVKFTRSNYAMNKVLTFIQYRNYIKAIINLAYAFINSKNFANKMLRLIWCKFI